MGLSYFGYTNGQDVARQYLKPDVEDKNVSPYQLVDYVNTHASQRVNVNALSRLGGNPQLLKLLLANNFPVIIEKGYEVEDLGWMGHYLLVVGYDDSTQAYSVFDSYLGAKDNNNNFGRGILESYADLEYYWRHFNYLFVVLYEPERYNFLLQLLGDHADPTLAIQKAATRAEQQATANSNDAWAWFNLGAAATMLGDYQRGSQSFDVAFSLGMPWRTLWYLHTPYIAYFATGRYNDVIARANTTESGTIYVEETYFYRGAAKAMLGEQQSAINDFNKAIRRNNNFIPASTALQAVQNGAFTPDIVLELAPSGG
jgi:tetratricopeptide (TPR) repeat protein